MQLILEKRPLQVIYTVIIISLYLFFILIFKNPITSFVLTLNLFYFSRELLKVKLFETTLNQNLNHAVPKHESLIVSESELLPENIRNILKTAHPVTN